MRRIPRSITPARPRQEKHSDWMHSPLSGSAWVERRSPVQDPSGGMAVQRTSGILAGDLILKGKIVTLTGFLATSWCLYLLHATSGRYRQDRIDWPVNSGFATFSSISSTAGRRPSNLGASDYRCAGLPLELSDFLGKTAWN
jgi:hypothetical protein